MSVEYSINKQAGTFFIVTIWDECNNIEERLYLISKCETLINTSLCCIVAILQCRQIYTPYWQRLMLKSPFGEQGGPEGQKQSFSWFLATSANTSVGGVNL